MLADMTKNMVKPKNILLKLKEHNDKNVTTIRQMYTAKITCQRSLRGPRIEMQHLMYLLERDMYIHWHVTNDEVVCDIFWTHLDAVKLLNAFNIVFFMDTSYKTNRYRLPLLDIVGVTCTGLTFSIAFAYMEAECEKNFMWALETFKDLFPRHDELPKVIVTDKDLALMNALKMCFLIHIIVVPISY